MVSIDLQNILQYLNSLRKTHIEDPRQRWVGYYNHKQMIFNKFFKWLYNSDEPDQRKRVTPPCMHGIRLLPKKEKSRYEHTDIWRTWDNVILLK